MPILVKTLSGKTLSFDIEPSATVLVVKGLIQETEMEGIPLNLFGLSFRGTRLISGIHTLAEYGVTSDDSTLHLIICPRSFYLTHEHKLYENTSVPVVCTCNRCGRGPMPSSDGPLHSLHQAGSFYGDSLRKAASFYRCREGCDYDLCQHCYDQHPHTLTQNDTAPGETVCNVCQIKMCNAVKVGGTRLLPYYRCGSGCDYDLCRLCHDLFKK